MSKQVSSTALILVATGLLMFLAGCETSKHAEVMGAESLAAKKQMEEVPLSESSGVPLGKEGFSQESINAASSEANSEIPPITFSPEGPPGATLRGLDREPALGEAMDLMDNGAEMASESESFFPETVTPEPPPIPDSFPTGNRGPAAGFTPEGPAMPSFGETAESAESIEAEMVESEMMESEGTTMSNVIESTVAEPEDSFDPGLTGYEDQEFESSSGSSDFMPPAPPLPTFGQEPASETEIVVDVPVPDMTETETVVAVPDMMDATPPPMEITPMEPEDMGGATETVSEIADVFFDFDQFGIRSDAAAILSTNAQILQDQNQGVSLLIEGHCDERGTEEYNMVLGERRAQSVKKYLVDLGIPASDIQIVSYGKERPFCTDHYDACWDQNRRGHFVIQ